MADKTGYIGRNPGDSSVIIAKQNYALTGNQTEFAFSAGYTVGYMDVYLNGARLISPTDYSATDGSTVTLTVAAINGDVVELVAYKAFNLGNVTTAGGNFTVGNNLTVGGNINVTGTYNIGISSAGDSIASEIKTLNFIGAGNTLVYHSSTNTVDISIAGGGGGGIGTALGETSPLDEVFKTANTFGVGAGTSLTVDVDDANCGNIAFMKPGNVHVGSGATFHIAPNTTLVTNVLGIFV
tara:strand:- start:1045 stop:1761 length:717 start_codon:yes stop_codon:yes gene_type:complete